MRTQCQDDIMLDFQILRISQILNVEELFYFLDAVFCQIDCLLFLIDDKISGLLDLLAHDRVYLGELAAGFAPLKLARQNIASLIQLC